MQKLATIEKVKEILPHSGADKLEIAHVAGLKCVVKKGSFKPGDWCVLIQPDTVLPDAPWAEFYKKGSPLRVKAQKLRGVYSFGIVLPLQLLQDLGIQTTD